MSRRVRDPFRRETFGQKLAELRREAKLTQRQVAERIGVSVTYLCDLENGRRPIPLFDRIQDLSVAIGSSRGERGSVEFQLVRTARLTIGTCAFCGRSGAAS